MKNIRIGNDISLEWRILRNGRAEKFEGKEIKVSLLDYQGREQEISYSTRDNLILVDYMGKSQSRLGIYTIVLYENEGKENMATVDHVQAFRLVEHSYMEGDSKECPCIKTESVKLDSDFLVGHSVNVIDNLKSNSQKDALSANQGRVLDEKMIQVEKKIPLKVSDLTNDLYFTKKSYVDEADRQQNEEIVKRVSSSDVKKIEVYTQDEFTNLGKKEETTLYIIR